MAKSKVHIPVINLKASEGELIWKLITELEKPNIAKVFLGKKIRMMYVLLLL
jgi:hypothetical protein